jgi:uncharacterized protein YcbX
VRLTGINVHPVKSTATRPVPEAHLDRPGLRDDRRWMLVDADGVLVSARECHALFRIVSDTPATDPDVTSGLRLRAEGHPDLPVEVPDGRPVPVRLHRHDLTAVPAGDEADAWVRAVAGRGDLRLVWCDDPTRRPLNPARSSPGDHTAFADGYPVTVASEASLARLNDWVLETAAQRGEEPREQIPMTRFRPSLVVDGDAPFAEDAWTGLEVGDGADAVRLRLAKPTDRCVMTTIDLATLATGPEPIRTLARHRRPVDATLFAVSMIPETTGRVRVGDPVRAYTG